MLALRRRIPALPASWRQATLRSLASTSSSPWRHWQTWMPRYDNNRTTQILLKNRGIASTNALYSPKDNIGDEKDDLFAFESQEDFENCVQYLFEPLCPTSRLPEEPWRDALLQIKNPQAKALVTQLDPIACPMGYDPHYIHCQAREEQRTKFQEVQRRINKLEAELAKERRQRKKKKGQRSSKSNQEEKGEEMDFEDEDDDDTDHDENAEESANAKELEAKLQKLYDQEDDEDNEIQLRSHRDIANFKSLAATLPRGVVDKSLVLSRRQIRSGDNENILDVYEAFGVDAILIVEHAELEPVEAYAMVHCPVEKVQTVLDQLTAKGFTVAILEQKDALEAKHQCEQYHQSQSSPGLGDYKDMMILNGLHVSTLLEMKPPGRTDAEGPTTRVVASIVSVDNPIYKPPMPFAESEE